MFMNENDSYNVHPIYCRCQQPLTTVKLKVSPICRSRFKTTENMSSSTKSAFAALAQTSAKDSNLQMHLVWLCLAEASSSQLCVYYVHVSWKYFTYLTYIFQKKKTPDVRNIQCFDWNNIMDMMTWAACYQKYSQGIHFYLSQILHLHVETVLHKPLQYLPQIDTITVSFPHTCGLCKHTGWPPTSFCFFLPICVFSADFL